MSVLARTRHGDRVLDGSGTLMAQCLRAGLPVASSCSGRGACAKCAVRVLAGAGRLTPAEPREALVLLREDLDEAMRLSCQARVGWGGEAVVIQTGYW